MIIIKSQLAAGPYVLSTRILEYSAIWLETRLINNTAVAFYEKKGYARIPNYGKYVDNIEAVCFEKRLL